MSRKPNDVHTRVNISTSHLQATTKMNFDAVLRIRTSRQQCLSTAGREYILVYLPSHNFQNLEAGHREHRPPPTAGFESRAIGRTKDSAVARQSPPPRIRFRTLLHRLTQRDARDFPARLEAVCRPTAFARVFERLVPVAGDRWIETATGEQGDELLGF